MQKYNALFIIVYHKTVILSKAKDLSLCHAQFDKLRHPSFNYEL